MKKLLILALLLLLPSIGYCEDTKVSALTELATTPAASDEFYVNDGGVSSKIQYSNIMAGVPAAETDAAHDTCAEVTDCVVSAITASSSDSLTNKTIDATNTVTINASDITDLAGTTDITADLEEEVHCADHDGRSTTCATDVLNADEETYIYTARYATRDPADTDDDFIDELAHAVTFTSIYCKTLVGTVTLDVTSGGTDIEGTDIVCDTDGQSDAGISNASGSVSDEIKLEITSVASSPTYLMVILNGTFND